VVWHAALLTFHLAEKKAGARVERDEGLLPAAAVRGKIATATGGISAAPAVRLEGPIHATDGGAISGLLGELMALEAAAMLRCLWAPVRFRRIRLPRCPTGRGHQPRLAGGCLISIMPPSS
jgi:hypothetical protein